MTFKYNKVVEKTIEFLQTDCARLYEDMHNNANQTVHQIKWTAADPTNHFPNTLIHKCADFVFAIHRFQAKKEALDYMLQHTEQEYACYCVTDKEHTCSYCQRFGRLTQDQPEFK